MAIDLERRWLLIVRRDRLELVSTMAARYPDAIVIVDRREVHRRQRSEPVPIERRERQRREPFALTEQIMWDALGYRLVYVPRAGPRAVSV